ncbi:YHYH protein [Aestuariibacter halophilus]|uniref:YHYH protein n=2 Tax=Fluctibacter halophilus TaxID=226011 RepID=A0ABS8G8X8_9ALTE|nr:YHYH protein [Aestuariibacter halophilus]
MDLQRGETFVGELTIQTQSSTCRLTSNEIPNHDFNDASAAFATPVSAQNNQLDIPTSPLQAGNVTPLSLTTTNGVFLNGATLDLLAAACYGIGSEPLGNEKIGCGQDQIDNPWRYDPMSALNTFGTDAHNAHTQPDGTYHYHGNPQALFDQDCDLTGVPSPVVGFAADGFPIYGSCFTDEQGNVRKALSSYQLKNNGGARQAEPGYQTPQAGVGVVASDQYDGQFVGDWEYQADSGDLDICNGMTVDGQYGYYITDQYPWVMGCFTGTPDPSFDKTGAALVNRMHAHPHRH